MTEISPEVDGDESDLKECLLETLKADGTLKQIQDQLTAAVYAALYRQTQQPSNHIPLPLTALTSSTNGVTAVSLLVDFLQSLELKKTLNVLMYESGLDGLKLEQRDDLIRHYNLQSASDNVPLLPVLLASFTAPSVKSSQLSKAVILDQESDNKPDELVRDNRAVHENHEAIPASPTFSVAAKAHVLPKSPTNVVASMSKSDEVHRDQTNSPNADGNVQSHRRQCLDNQVDQQSQFLTRQHVGKDDQHIVNKTPLEDHSVLPVDARSGTLDSSTGGNLSQARSRSDNFTHAVPSYEDDCTQTPSNYAVFYKQPPKYRASDISDNDSDIDSESTISRFVLPLRMI